jgi:hypothetical protein
MGTRAPEPRNKITSYTFLRRWTKQQIKTKWNQIHQNTSSGKAYYGKPSLSKNHALTFPTPVYSTITQLKTGHGFMKMTRHTHSAEEHQTLCDCGKPHTRDHILMECTLLTKQRRKFLCNAIQGRVNVTNIDMENILHHDKSLSQFAIEAKLTKWHKWYTKGKCTDPMPSRIQQIPRATQLMLLSYPGPSREEFLEKRREKSRKAMRALRERLKKQAEREE